MSTFEILFPIVAILSVPCGTWLMLRAARTEAGSLGVELDATRGLKGLLAVAILVSLAYLVVRGLVPRDVVPGNTLALLTALGGFHGLWWGMGMRLVRAQRKVLNARRTSPVEEPRFASLRLRAARDYLHPALLSLPLIIMVAGLAVLVWRLTAAPVPSAGFVSASVLALAAVTELILYRWWLSAEVRAPQMICGSDPARQEREWESLREFRVRLVFVMHCALPAVFFMFAVLTLEAFRGTLSGATIGLLGGIVGITLGLTGAAYGVMATLRRRRLYVEHTLS